MGTALKSLVLALLACATSLSAAAEPRLKVALTFDDMPVNGAKPQGVTSVQITRETLAVLKKHRVPPSYGFINARQLEDDEYGAEALKLWVKAGHPLASHSYSHFDLTKTSVEDFQRDILRNEPALELLMPHERGQGRHDYHWFRYPFLREGDTLEKRRAIRTFLAANRYQIAQTTLDYEDYLWNSAYARCLDRKDAASMQMLRETYLATADEYMRAQTELARRVFGRDISHVLLLHLGAFSAEIMPDLLALLKKQNFEIVTLEEAQSDPVYSMDPDLAAPRGGTLTEQMANKLGTAWPETSPFPRERVDGACR